VAWRSRLTRAAHVGAKVICVGNLTAGGTGKTPVAIAIARALQARGAKVAFLSRGYGGTEVGPQLVDKARHTARDVGDEPLLLANVAPTVIARDRAEGARLAVSRGADVIVMDDGHQNFAVRKDFSLVVVDSKCPFGNGRVLPAGPLRERPKQGLKRADAIVIVGDGAPPSLQEITLPSLRVRIEPDNAAVVKGKRVLAFAGIGQPQRFFDTLRALTNDLVETRTFDDHHTYTADEIAAIESVAQREQVLPVTTEKDWVRLPPEARERIAFLAVHARFDDDAALGRLLDRVVRPAANA